MQNKRNAVCLTEKNANERHLDAVFRIMKKDGVVLSGKKTHFNDKELHLIREVLLAKKAGKRVIATQLSQRLGVTRSAISQLVNRLEKNGVLKRVHDEINKKILYIEVTEKAVAYYRSDIRICNKFIQQVVEKFGEERFEQMCGLLGEFSALCKEGV